MQSVDYAREAILKINIEQFEPSQDEHYYMESNQYRQSQFDLNNQSMLSNTIVEEDKESDDDESHH
jgi:hypothetical protein